MNFLQKLFRPTDHFAESKQVIEYAFTCGGIDYYQHTDEMNMPYRRALKALTFYKELDMKCDRLYLESHIRAMENLFGGKKIGFDELAKMKRLNDQLKERVEWIVVDDHIYKIASVRFFDRNENPDDYDYKYNEKKIAHWKASERTADFFFARAAAEVSTVFKICAARFRELFSGDPRAESGTFGLYLADTVTRAEDGLARLYRETLLSGDTSREAAIAHLGIYDYLSQLNEKILALKQKT